MTISKSTPMKSRSSICSNIVNSSFPATMALQLQSNRGTTSLLQQAAFQTSKAKDALKSKKRTTEDLLAFPSLEWLKEDDEQDLRMPADAVTQCLQDALVMTRDFDATQLQAQQRASKRRRTTSVGMVRSNAIPSSLSSLAAVAAFTSKEEKLTTTTKLLDVGNNDNKLAVPKLQTGVSKLRLSPVPSLISKNAFSHHGPSRSLTLKCTVSPLA